MLPFSRAARYRAERIDLVGALAMARAIGDVDLSDDILSETAAALKDL